MFRAFDRALVAATSALVAALTGLMCVVVLLGVVTRYFLNDALPWTEEAARYTLIWLSWLGGGLAMRKGAHIAAELVIDCLPALPRKIVVTTGRIGVLLFLAICVWYGLELVNRVSFQSTIALGVSMQLPYAAVPVGSALMIYHMLVIAFGSDKAVTRDTEIQI
jgi:TRAP-type C4-dicarboxylate transport system permease small subunit